jgi:hypothetical protein
MYTLKNVHICSLLDNYFESEGVSFIPCMQNANVSVKLTMRETVTKIYLILIFILLRDMIWYPPTVLKCIKILIDTVIIQVKYILDP